MTVDFILNGRRQLSQEACEYCFVQLHFFICVKTVTQVRLVVRDTPVFPKLIPSTPCVKTVPYMSDRVIHHALPNFLCVLIVS